MPASLGSFHLRRNPPTCLRDLRETRQLKKPVLSRVPTWETKQIKQNKKFGKVPIA